MITWVGGLAASAAGPSPTVTPTVRPGVHPVAPGEGPHGVGVLPALLLVLSACAVVGLVVVARRLRESSPWLWWPTFGAVVAGWRLVRSWRPLCEGAGLSVPARRFGRFGLLGGGTSGLVVRGEPLRMVTPRRTGVQYGRCGMAVTVRMHPSQTPHDYARAAEAIAHAWRVHAVRASSGRPGFVTLNALGFDPLRHPPTSRNGTRGSHRGRHVRRTHRAGARVVAEPVGADAGRGVLVVPVGVGEDGSPWRIDMTTRAHHLVTGATQSGKSTLTVRLVSVLAARPVALVGIDAKGGMELGPFTPRLSALATSRAEAAVMLDTLCTLLRARMFTCRGAGARSIWELPPETRPAPLVLVVDEVAELFLSADKAGKEQATRCVTGLVRLAQLGAALGVHLWIAGQRFGSDLGGGATLLRAQLAGRICHRVANAQTAGMTLDGLPPEAIEAAQQIPPELPGVAVVGDDTGAWSRARSFHVPLADAVATAREYAHLAVALPEVTAAVEQARAEEEHDAAQGPAAGGGGR